MPPEPSSNARASFKRPTKHTNQNNSILLPGWKLAVNIGFSHTKSSSNMCEKQAVASLCPAAKDTAFADASLFRALLLSQCLSGGTSVGCGRTSMQTSQANSLTASSVFPWGTSQNTTPPLVDLSSFYTSRKSASLNEWISGMSCHSNRRQCDQVAIQPASPSY